MCCYFKASVKLNMSTLLVTDIDPRLETTRVLSTTGLCLEATGISTSASIYRTTRAAFVPIDLH
jgi:hypothetical protein